MLPNVSQSGGDARPARRCERFTTPFDIVGLHDNNDQPRQSPTPGDAPETLTTPVSGSQRSFYWIFLIGHVDFVPILGELCLL